MLVICRFSNFRQGFFFRFLTYIILLFHTSSDFIVFLHFFFVFGILFAFHLLCSSIFFSIFSFFPFVFSFLFIIFSVLCEVFANIEVVRRDCDHSNYFYLSHIVILLATSLFFSCLWLFFPYFFVAATFNIIFLLVLLVSTSLILTFESHDLFVLFSICSPLPSIIFFLHFGLYLGHHVDFPATFVGFTRFSGLIFLLVASTNHLSLAIVCNVAAYSLRERRRWSETTAFGFARTSSFG